MRKMRLSIFTIMLTLCITNIVAAEIQMSCRPITTTGNGPRRMPSNNNGGLSANYDENSGLLNLTYSVPNTSFTYYIYDEDGEIVSSSDGLFTNTGDWSAFIGLLPSGYYSIEVFIDSIVYFGELIL